MLNPLILSRDRTEDEENCSKRVLCALFRVCLHAASPVAGTQLEGDGDSGESAVPSRLL